jgi:hypothetical protein
LSPIQHENDAYRSGRGLAEKRGLSLFYRKIALAQCCIIAQSLLRGFGSALSQLLGLWMPLLS